jgi:hypothetical protein
MGIEEEYQDVLQNIEFAIVQEYRRDQTLLDYDVADALEALTRAYRSEAGGRAPAPVRLDGKPRRVFDAVRAVCEWRLGRPGAGAEPPTGVAVGPGAGEISPGEIVECLKRIEKSVHRWNKQNGRQGYLTFVSEFIL